MLYELLKLNQDELKYYGGFLKVQL